MSWTPRYATSTYAHHAADWVRVKAEMGNALTWIEKWRDESQKMLLQYGVADVEPVQKRRKTAQEVDWTKTFLPAATWDNLRALYGTLVAVSDNFFADADNVALNLYMVPRHLFTQDRAERLFGCLRQRCLDGACDHQSVLRSLAEYRTRLDGAGRSFSDILATPHVAGSNNYEARSSINADAAHNDKRTKTHHRVAHMQHRRDDVAPLLPSLDE